MSATTVDLASLQEGETFAGALVLLVGHRRVRVMGRQLAFFDVRQEPPVVYSCCVSDDEQLARKTRHACRRRANNNFVRISGMLRPDRNIDITDVEDYDSQEKNNKEQQHESELLPLYYYRSDVDDNSASQKVLQETSGHDLLQTILERYVPLEDIEFSVMPLCHLWHSVGMSILQSSCQLMDMVDLELALFDVFQSARLLYHQCTRAGFQNQKEYSDLMLAGAHLCELSLHRGGNNILRAVHVRNDAVEALGLERQRQQRPTRPATYTDSELQFVKAACIQLSKLDLERHQGHISRVGYALHNYPRHFSPKRTLPGWAAPLEDDDLLCQELKTAGCDHYGLDWYWRILPEEW